jgi:DNA (cytosine-5)-methyltransferase 1
VPPGEPPGKRPVRPGRFRNPDGPSLVSLFSGCGGLDLGFEQAGFRRVWANDFDPAARAVFALNLGEIDGRDITSVKVSEIPDSDVITAGFPCQPFSSAGKREGVLDSRGLLYRECLRIIEAKSPKAVVFENVKGLMSSRFKDGRRLSEVIAQDMSGLGPHGYDVSSRLVNASDHGVPQNRLRVFIVGVRADLGVAFDFPRPRKSGKLTLRHALDVPEGAKNHVYGRLSPQAERMIRRIPQGGSWKDVPYKDLPERLKRIRDDMRRHHYPRFYCRRSLDEICGTITARATPENCGVIHPVEDRRFTIREIARIQSFPDSFLFLDSTAREIAAMYRVLGNAVPVRLAKRIATALMRQVFGKG